jgi:hypothetical protein
MNDRKAIAVRQFVASGLVLFALLFVVGHCSGCGWLPGDDASEAELAYRAALLRCVDKATTLAESKACRKQVDNETFGGTR